MYSYLRNSEELHMRTQLIALVLVSLGLFPFLTPRSISAQSLTCSIDKTSTPWNPPGKMNVAIDGTGVGSFTFDLNGTSSLDFACSAGSHDFVFNVDGAQVSCSGTFAPDQNHTHFLPAMRLNADKTTSCSLTSN